MRPRASTFTSDGTLQPRNRKRVHMSDDRETGSSHAPEWSLRSHSLVREPLPCHEVARSEAAPNPANPERPTRRLVMGVRPALRARAFAVLSS